MPELGTFSNCTLVVTVGPPTQIETEGACYMKVECDTASKQSSLYKEGFKDFTTYEVTFGTFTPHSWIKITLWQKRSWFGFQNFKREDGLVGEAFCNVSELGSKQSGLLTLGIQSKGMEIGTIEMKFQIHYPDGEAFTERKGGSGKQKKSQDTAAKKLSGEDSQVNAARKQHGLEKTLRRQDKAKLKSHKGEVKDKAKHLPGKTEAKGVAFDTPVEFSENISENVSKKADNTLDALFDDFDALNVNPNEAALTEDVPNTPSKVAIDDSTLPTDNFFSAPIQQLLDPFEMPFDAHSSSNDPFAEAESSAGPFHSSSPFSGDPFSQSEAGEDPFSATPTSSEQAFATDSSNTAFNTPTDPFATFEAREFEKPSPFDTTDETTEFAKSKEPTISTFDPFDTFPSTSASPGSGWLDKPPNTHLFSVEGTHTTIQPHNDDDWVKIEAPASTLGGLNSGTVVPNAVGTAMKQQQPLNSANTAEKSVVSSIEQSFNSLFQ